VSAAPLVVLSPSEQPEAKEYDGGQSNELGAACAADLPEHHLHFRNPCDGGVALLQDLFRLPRSRHRAIR
jgi:hypothetical protein